MKRHARGFTLIELLVVITIIGVLVGLLIPAVQAAREAARRGVCSSNLRQLSLACQSHLAKLGYYPSGGWGSGWVGVPEDGYGGSQPGGWIYNVLPFMENSPLHDLGKGLTGSASGAAYATRLQTAVAVLMCPSRRRAAPYPLLASSGGTTPGNPLPLSSLGGGPVTQGGRADYAINGGSVYVAHGVGPSSAAAAATNTWPSLTNFNGISCVHSQITDGAVTDGPSNTLLVGEKYMCSDKYTTGNDPGDLQSAYSGDDLSLVRWGSTSLVPLQDRAGVTQTAGASATPIDNYSKIFGSCHATGWFAAFCDGNVRPIGFAMDPTTLQNLCSRNDHQPIDWTKVTK